MPLLKIQTSIPAPDQARVETLLKDLSARLASQLGKPESYVMTAFDAGVPMTFGGTTDPVCYVEIKSVGTMGGAKTQAISQEFCAQLETALGVPRNRIYIEFADAAGAMWGWNGGTFG
jgi:phenylpyruvate tautomerase